MIQKMMLNIGVGFPIGISRKAFSAANGWEISGLTAGMKPYGQWCREDRWVYLLAIYGDSANMPEEIIQDIWGLEVLQAAMSPRDCPACADMADDGNPLCAYHDSRCCVACGGVTYCKSWCP